VPLFKVADNPPPLLQPISKHRQLLMTLKDKTQARDRSKDKVKIRDLPDSNNKDKVDSKGPDIKSQQLPNGNTRVGQSIYADDEPETAPIQAGQAAVAPSTYQMPANPVAMNKANDSGGGGSDDGDGPRGGGFQGPQGGGIAANNSPDNSPNPTRASGGSAKSKLSELAASLGTAVEDLQGRIKSGLGFGGPEGRRAGSRNSKGRGPASVQAAKLDEQVIRDRFGRIIRSTASRMEFGRANEPLFKGMCGHYATYAAQNRIPYDRSGCGE
jgi:hypothetical protein